MRSLHDLATLVCTVILCCLCEKVIRCADAGADLVRITVQGKREAKACKQIREKLNEKVGACVLLYPCIIWKLCHLLSSVMCPTTDAVVL